MDTPPTADPLIPPKLAPGDEVRVLALSRSLGGVRKLSGFTDDDVNYAVQQLQSLGLTVSFGACVEACNDHLTAPPQERINDLHAALEDPHVKAILAVSGGIGAIQMLDGVDYALVARHPKILCGYSDFTHLCCAFAARANVATYYGPNFTSFMMRRGFDYTRETFRACLFNDAPLPLTPAEQWSDDAWHVDQDSRNFTPNEGWWAVQPGEAEGVIGGGSHSTLATLHGSPYAAPLRDAVLFLEQPAMGKATLMFLDASLRAMSFHPDFANIRGLVIGRFARDGRVTQENLSKLLSAIPALRGLPVIANCDFGHTTPIATLPIGGRCRLSATPHSASIALTRH